MAKVTTYLAGVADCELFQGDQLFASARTLIDSSITIGTSVEELRAGRGNALWGKYYHTSTFDLKLTDAMFNLEYLAANIGGEIELGGDVFKDEQLEASEDGTITLSVPAVPVRAGSTTVYAYVRKADEGGAKRVAYKVTEDNTVIGLDAGAIYCVRYMYNDGTSRKLTINSNFIPGTFSIIMTASLFSGDACNTSNSGTEVGQLTIKVPRFQLNGSQELSMSASGISNTSLEGSALASGCTGCNDNGVYAEIIETIFNSVWYDNFTGLQVEEAEAEVAKNANVNETMVVYAVPASGSPIQVTNEVIAAKEANTKEDMKTKLVFGSAENNPTGIGIDPETGAISGKAPATAGTFTFTVDLANATSGEAIPGFSATKTIEVV